MRLGGKMPNILLPAMGVLVAITSTLVAASPTEPRSSNTTSVNLTFVPSSLTTGDSVSQETTDMTIVTDSPNSRKRLRTSLSVPPQTSTEVLPSLEGITVPTSLTETTVSGMVDTESITTKVDTIDVDVATPQEGVDTATPQEEEEEEVDTATLLEEEEVDTATLLEEEEVDTATLQEEEEEVDTATLLEEEEVDTATLLEEKVDTATLLEEKVDTATLLEEVDTATPQEEGVDTATLLEEEVDTATLLEEEEEEEEVDTATLLEEVDAAMPQEVGNAAPQEEVEAVALQEFITTTPQDTVAPQEEVDTVNVFSREKVKLTPLKDEVSTASYVEEVNSAHPVASEANTQASKEEEEVRSTALQRVTTSVPISETTQKTGDSAGVLLGKMDRVPTRPDQLVKCFCGGQEVLTSSGCQGFQAGTIIHMQKRSKTIGLKAVAELDVVVHDLHCDVEDDHREMKFTKGQFYLRKRGDMVLLEDAGQLEGLRINNYCVSHFLDDEGDLTWMMKACIPPPSVPTCCLPGHALKGGVCRPAPTPDLLTPPLSTEPFENSIEWPVIKNRHNPITCTSDSMKTLEIPTKKSHLIALPIGVTHTWLPVKNIYKRKFTFPPNLCVDAQQNLDGSVKYFVILCYSNPEERHHQICDGNICVRKCCDIGKVMDTSLYRCVPFARAAFEPPITASFTEYKTVTGVPLCAPQSQVKGNISINEKGYLVYEGRTFPPTDYCVDKFSNNKGKTQNSGLACLTNLSTWDRARDIVLPIAQAISIIFLFLTVLGYSTVPVLLRNGGWYQLCHVLSLVVAYSSAFIQMQFSRLYSKSSCIAMGLVMQYSFLAAFFWLSVLCFEVWRKVRSLNRLMPCATMPVWVYPLYAFGGPLTIGIITICMQFLAPDNVEGLIKPYLGVTNCWFIGDFELFLYFYGPIAFLFSCNIAFIAHTFWNYKKIEANSKVLRNLKGEQPSKSCNPVSRTILEQKHRKRDYIADFKQQFSLLVLISGSWVCEVLSWKIPPPELWALTDVLNTLQGFFVFVIFMTNRGKRRHIKERFPKIFVAVKQIKSVFQKLKSFLLCRDTEKIVSLSVHRMASQVSKKLSDSSMVSSLSTLSLRLSSSSSSFHITSSPSDKVRRSSSVSDSEDGVITLSHSQSSLSSSDNSVENTFF